MYCSTCGDERRFERTPCLDGHGPDCPERACVECGAAVLVGPDATLGDDETPLPRPARTAPPAPAAAAAETPATSATGNPGTSASPAAGNPGASTAGAAVPAASAPSDAPVSMPSDPASGGPDRAAPATVRAVA
ncbi:hypothetical protein [Actinomadura rupiterrae]|uniref:hypothetical protein n=1 Tax=Actinomadura rupiterrae TaxID=559627 RepID=UPI0020A3084B|nr:hypothetical protein [Actinomadura rupiterrae]MCP2336022.1 hypothetical protein [Actinomadura rupiterrae]